MNESTANVVSIHELTSYLRRCYGVTDVDASFTNAALKLERKVRRLVRARDHTAIKHLVAQIRASAV